MPLSKILASTTTELPTAQQSLRQKKPYKRTKLGCRPCKRRKIRCDEGWPICHNCSKTNRPCERGPPSSSRSAAFKFKAPLTISHFFQPPPSTRLAGLAQQDMPYLDAFRYRLVDDIVGPATRPAWKGQMMQTLDQEPAFRHAVVAFGAACGLLDGAEWRPSSAATTSLPVPAPNKTLALRHYHQCLQGVQRLIREAEGGHVDSTLFCALMSICFELRVGTPHLALPHLEHSLDIINANSAKVTDDLALAFAKLDIQASMFLGNRIPKTDMASLAHLSLGDGGEAPEMDRALTYLLGRTFQFLRANPGVFRGLGTIIITQSIHDELVALQEDLESFRTSHTVTGVPDPAVARTLSLSRQILWITCLILHVVLSSCLCGDEMVYDSFLPHFEAIAAMAEGILSSASRYATGYKDFRLNTALLFPLYMTGQLCRHPTIRRKIMHLMGSASFDEGVWDGSSGQKYIQVLMRLEEQGLNLEGRDLDDCGPSVIPGRNRIRALDIQPAAAERYSTLFFRFSPQTDRWDELVETVVW